jgi:MFS family permease
MVPYKINIWATGTLVSVWISPFIVGFLATRLYWRWVYGVTCILGSITTLTTIVLGEETYAHSVLSHPTLTDTQVI